MAYNTGVFHDACRDWRKKHEADKTWANFKTHFTEAHLDFRTYNKPNPYQSANVAILHQEAESPPSNPTEETATALANLASATAADRTAVAALTTTNEHLTKQLTEVTNQLTLALSKISTLEQSLQSMRCTPLPNNPNPAPRKERNYCWTHGFKVSRNHNSMTCRFPKEGHQRQATATNIMGGSTVGINSTK